METDISRPGDAGQIIICLDLGPIPTVRTYVMNAYAVGLVVLFFALYSFRVHIPPRLFQFLQFPFIQQQQYRVVELVLQRRSLLHGDGVRFPGELVADHL